MASSYIDRVSGTVKVTPVPCLSLYPGPLLLCSQTHLSVSGRVGMTSRPASALFLSPEPNTQSHM